MSEEAEHSTNSSHVYRLCVCDIDPERLDGIVYLFLYFYFLIYCALIFWEGEFTFFFFF